MSNFIVEFRYLHSKILMCRYSSMPLAEARAIERKSFAYSLLILSNSVRDFKLSIRLFAKDLLCLK